SLVDSSAPTSYTLSLHDALPILAVAVIGPITSEIQNRLFYSSNQGNSFSEIGIIPFYPTAFHFTSDGSIYANTGSGIFKTNSITDRKSTRLNSSHVKSSYAVFCL